MIPTTTIPDFLTAQEVGLLLDHFDRCPCAVEKTKQHQDKTIIYNRHKNIDYNMTGSLVRQIIYPKLEKIIGPHTMDNGSLLESHYPYPIHLDTHQDSAKKNFYCHSHDWKNQAVLISLNEDPCFKTVMFEYFADLLDYSLAPIGDGTITDTIQDPRYENLDLSHLADSQIEFIKNIKITSVYHWKIGSALLWPRNQLHTSTNFYHSAKHKKAVVIFC
jgi:hypothetical protein